MTVCTIHTEYAFLNFDFLKVKLDRTGSHREFQR